MVAGRVALEQEGADGTIRRVAEVGARHVLGEVALVTGEQHPETAVATRDATLLRLDRETFMRLGAREPRVLVAVIRVLNERLREAAASGAAGTAPRPHAPAERGLSAVWSGSGLHRGIVDLRGSEGDDSAR